MNTSRRLVFLAGVVLLALPAAGFAQITRILISKSGFDTPCSPGPAATLVSASDARIGLFVQLSGVGASDIVQVVWANLDTMFFPPLDLQPARQQSGATTCFVSVLNVAGTDVARNPGTWMATVALNGNYLNPPAVFSLAAANCSYALSSASASIPAGGGSGSVNLTATAGCAWSITFSTDPQQEGANRWFSLDSPSSGTGNATVRFTVRANATSSPRTANLLIAGQAFTVTQAAAAAPGVTPVINSGGVVNGADFTPNFAPGGIISIYGTNLAAGLNVAAGAPLPASLDGVSVEVVDGARTLTAPLYFISAGQINAQLPFEVASTTLRIRVRRSQAVSNEQTITWQARNPRLFTVPPGGTGAAAVIHNDGKGTLVSDAAPAQPGEVLTAYLTGLGAVTPAAVTGSAGGDNAGLGPLNSVNTTVTVTVAGAAAEVQWAGLAPYYVGLYQVNFRVPQDVTAGTLELKVSAQGRESQARATIASGGGWQALASANIGASGGAVTGGGLTLTAPAGAFAGANAVKVMRSTGQTPEENQTGDTFGITGLPATTSAPLTVSVDVPGTAPDPDGTYLVVSEASTGGGELFLKATVQGNRVTATLPTRGVGLRAQAVKPSPGVAAAAGEPQAEASLTDLVILYVLTGGDAVRSPGGNLLFLFSTKLGIHDKVAQLAGLIDPAGGALDNFMTQVGFAAAWQEAKPVLVYLTTSQTGSAWSPGVFYDGARLGADTLVSLRDNWSASYVSIWHPDRPVDILYFVLVHELAHVLQDQAAPPTQDELAWKDHSWIGTQEAIAVAVTCKYIPDYWSLACSLNTDALEPLGELATSGLGYTWESGEDRVYFLAAAEANFLIYSAKYFAVAEGWAILGDIATQRGTGSSRVLPVDAISRVLKNLGLDIGDAWVAFWKHAALQLGPGALADAFGITSNPARVVKFTASDTTKSIAWAGSPNLTVNFYAVDFPVPWPWTDQRPLTISASATGSGKSPVVVVLHTSLLGQWEIVATGTSVTIDNPRDVAGASGRFYVMVVNPRAVSPFQSKADITLTAAFQAGGVFAELAQAAQAGKLTMQVSIQASDWWHIHNLTASSGGWATSPHLPVSVSGNSLKSSGTHTYNTSCTGSEVVSMELNFDADGSTLAGATATSDCTRQTTSDGKTETTQIITRLTIKKAIPFDHAGAGQAGDDFKSYYWVVRGAGVKDYLDAVRTLKRTGSADTTTTLTFSSGSELMVVLYRPFP